MNRYHLKRHLGAAKRGLVAVNYPVQDHYAKIAASRIGMVSAELVQAIHGGRDDAEIQRLKTSFLKMYSHWRGNSCRAKYAKIPSFIVSPALDSIEPEFECFSYRARDVLFAMMSYIALYLPDMMPIRDELAATV